VAIVLLASGRLARKDAIPFGPFLAVGGAVALLWGRAIVAWYAGGFEP
jgi:leader peptidase (prepilin peptidase)/N-methyltransferase